MHPDLISEFHLRILIRFGIADCDLGDVSVDGDNRLNRVAAHPTGLLGWRCSVGESSTSPPEGRLITRLASRRNRRTQMWYMYAVTQGQHRPRGACNIVAVPRFVNLQQCPG
jgi:hypothetical protein